MTVEQRAVAPSGFRAGAIAIAVAAAFGAGLVTGLAGQRLLPAAPIAMKSVDSPAAQTTVAGAARSTIGTVPDVAVKGMSDAVRLYVRDYLLAHTRRTDHVGPASGGPLVSPFTGFRIGTAAAGPMINPYTGFRTGALTRKPVVDPYTGFTTGWR